MYNKDADANGERSRFINSPARHTDGDFQQVKLFGYVKLRASSRVGARRLHVWELLSGVESAERTRSISRDRTFYRSLFLPARDRNTFYNRITPDASFFPPG